MKTLSKATLLFVSLLAATSAFAQYDTGEVLGTVKDPSGAGIPKAAVTLTNQGTSIEAKATTDENGNYDFFDARAGRYTVTVEATGFAKTAASDVDVVVGRTPARRSHPAGRQRFAVRRSIRRRLSASRPTPANTARSSPPRPSWNSR